MASLLSRYPAESYGAVAVFFFAMSRSAVNPDAVLFYYPKRARQLLVRQQRQHPPDRGRDRWMRLIGQAQYDNTREVRWRVGQDVGEIQVQRHQRPQFPRAYAYDAPIRLTTKGLFCNGMSVVPCGAKHFGQRRRKIFVELESHAALVCTTRSRANSAA